MHLYKKAKYVKIVRNDFNLELMKKFTAQEFVDLFQFVIVDRYQWLPIEKDRV